MDSESSEVDRQKNNWWTLPNVITLIRIVGSPLLVVLGALKFPWWLAIWTAILVVTEWLDGFLARRLKVESAVGARLDTIADAIFYSCILIAVACLVPEKLVAEVYWIAIAIGSYFCSWLASWFKFGCLPSYHTWMAKGSWLLVAPGIVLMVLGWDVWLFRSSMMIVVLTNVEAMLITQKLNKARVDVRSVWVLSNEEGLTQRREDAELQRVEKDEKVEGQENEII